MVGKWYFAKTESNEKHFKDVFVDNIFGDDEEKKWENFAREIIQNSIDARKDEKLPVIVEFDLNRNLSLNDVPGGKKLLDVLGKCALCTAHEGTRTKYRKGCEILSNDKICCLKVSDKNTIGLETGRDKAWGALLCDYGVTFKPEGDSAGCHGVGKQAAFLLSACNTVFYATKNSTDCLVQGKTMLVTWYDDDIKMERNGIYGKVDLSKSPDYRVDALNAKDIDAINPYFVRKDVIGTDIIIVGVNAFEKEYEEEMKKSFIKAILENFFVSIMSGKLEVSILGLKINSKNIKKIFNEYYDAKRYTTVLDLKQCLSIYNPNNVKHIEEIYGKKQLLGKINIYVELGGRFSKRNYCIVRTQGMKISETQVKKAGQPFTAIVEIVGKDLNTALKLLENATHNKFQLKDLKSVAKEDKEKYENANAALNNIKSVVSKFIAEYTAVEPKDEQTISGMEDIFEIPEAYSALIAKGKRNKTSGSNPNQNPNPNPSDGYFTYTNFKNKPLFIKNDKDNSYNIKFVVNDDINNCKITIRSVNSDDKEDKSITDFIEHFYDDEGKEHLINGGEVCGLNISKDKLVCFKIVLKQKVTYRLRLKISQEENDLNE